MSWRRRRWASDAVPRFRLPRRTRAAFWLLVHSGDRKCVSCSADGRKAIRTLAAPPGSDAPRSGRYTVSFGIYLVGYIILICGLTLGAHLLHVPTKWIAVAVICLVGIAILHGVTVTRQKDPPK